LFPFGKNSYKVIHHNLLFTSLFKQIEDKNNLMSVIKTTLLVCFLGLLLSACASLSKQECLNGDWYEIGYDDGHNGEKRNRFSKHVKACAEYQVTVNKQTYMYGREKGLLSYCTVENALQEGLNGRTYEYVCSGHIEPAFLNKYRQGKAIYQLDKKISEHESRISSLEYKLKKKAHKYTEEEKKDFRKEIEHLEIRIEEKTKHLYYLKGQIGL